MSNAGKQLIEHKDRISAETYEDIVRTMVETGNNLKDISTNMLNWIRHHSDNAKLLPESLDLYDIVQHVTDNVTPMSKFKQIVILNHTTADITLNQYKEPLKNILLQLLSNAIKYCNKCDIIITSKQDSDYVTVSIADEGPGMTKEQIQHLTNAEMSGTHTNTYQNKGHGFGYLIIKDMLAIIDGSIAIDSKQHHGTTVHITFPSQIQTI
jgi:signal transduction histidine kinase